VKGVWNTLVEKLDSLVKVVHGKLTMWVDKYSGEIISMEDGTTAYANPVNRIIMTTVRDVLTNKAFLVASALFFGAFSYYIVLGAITISPLFLANFVNLGVMAFALLLGIVAYNLPTNMSDFEETDTVEGEPALIVTEDTINELTLVAIILFLVAVPLMILLV
jgi:hypothetical protein